MMKKLLFIFLLIPLLGKSQVVTIKLADGTFINNAPSGRDWSIFNGFTVHDANQELAHVLNSNPDFEDGTTNGYNFTITKRDPTKTGIAEVVTVPHPVRKGKHSLHFQASEYRRSEATVHGVPAENIEGGMLVFHWGQEYWMGQSVYLKDYNSNPPEWTTIIQTHSTPHAKPDGKPNWAECCGGEGGWNIYTWFDKGVNKLGIQGRVIPDAMTKVPKCGAISRVDAYEIPCPENQWLDFVFNFKFSTGSDGFMKIWLNGELVVDITGPNVLYLDSCGKPRSPYHNLQTGVYKPKNTATKDIYIDELKIAGADGNYELVAPRDDTPVNNPPITINGITILASGYQNQPPDNVYPPKQIFDGDLTTKWAAKGFGHWVQFSLPKVKIIESIDVAFTMGNRNDVFDLLVSADSINWTTILDKQVGSLGTDFNNYDFVDVEAKHIKYIAQGNIQSNYDWNSISEVRFNYKLSDTIPPIIPPDIVITDTVTVRLLDMEYQIIREGRFQIFIGDSLDEGEHNEYEKAIEHALRSKALNPNKNITIKSPLRRIELK